MRRHAKVLVAAFALLASLGTAQALADTAPSVTIGAPSAVTYTSAHLSGTVDPHGGPSEANWYFEYSTDDASWTQAGAGNAGSGSGPVNVATDLTELSAGTQYFVRLVATNDGGETISATPDPSFTTPAYPAPTATIDPFAGPSGLSAHFSGSVDPNGIKTAYRFELAVDDGTPNWEAFGKGNSASASPVAIEADRDLEAQTKYLIRIVATSLGGTATSSEESLSTGTLAPTARVIPGSGRTTTALRLNATINPNGLATTYRFEWGTSTSYGNVIPASGPDSYGGQGTSMVRYSKQISGLAPGTTIHYRVVAQNADGTSTSADQTVVTLSEEVGYEMVSPPDKGNGNLSFCCGVEADASGEKATYISPATFGGAVGSLQINPYLSSRSSENWSTKGLILPQTTNNKGFTNGGTQGFAPDLSHAFQFSREALLPGAVVGNSNMYLHDLETGEIKFVATFPEGFGMAISDAGIFMGGSSDGSHMVFRANKALTPDALEGQSNIYDYTEGKLKLVSYLPGDAAAFNAQAGLGNAPKDRLKYNAVSSDGSRIFLQQPFGPLYVRENDQRTTLISASHRTGDDPTIEHSAYQSWASKDGSTIYFTSYDALTDDTPATPPGIFLESLYRYDVDSGALTYIAPGGGGPSNTNFVKRILGVSDDGSTVYYAAGYSDPALEFSTDSFPSNRLYRAVNGVSHFIGETSPELNANITGGVASPNGRYFTFTSPTDTLTTPPSNGCQGCNEVYVYNADTNRFSCASCNPSGAVTGETLLDLEAEENTGGYSTRVITDDGSVFFESHDRLVPEDTNDKIDVYRWKAGQLDLVSRGFGSEDSFLGDVTPDGRSVFFFTGERLVGQDVDRSQDLYVARFGGGLPAQNPAAPEPPCFGEGCLNRSPDSPPDIAPGSNGFAGPGNERSAAHKRKGMKCGKGRHTRKTNGKVRCVKRTTAKNKGGRK